MLAQGCEGKAMGEKHNKMREEEMKGEAASGWAGVRKTRGLTERNHLQRKITLFQVVIHVSFICVCAGSE